MTELRPTANASFMYNVYKLVRSGTRIRDKPTDGDVSKYVAVFPEFTTFAHSPALNGTSVTV